MRGAGGERGFGTRALLGKRDVYKKKLSSTGRRVKKRQRTKKKTRGLLGGIRGGKSPCVLLTLKKKITRV